MIYLLSCETIQYGGGIYAYELTKDGLLEKKKYFPCDRPMYAVRCKQGLCVLLRQPFENDNSVALQSLSPGSPRLVVSWLTRLPFVSLSLQAPASRACAASPDPQLPT